MKAATSLVLTAILACTACGSGTDELVSTGDAGHDQTARYARYLIAELEQRPSMDTPSKALGYLFSTAGSAELTPPHPEAEPDAAAHYHGPYPADDTKLTAAYNPDAFFAKQLALSADDAAMVIRARAYRTGSDAIVHEWEWPYERD